MKRIYKYELALTDLQRVAMPKGAEIFTVAIQNNKLQLWAMVDTSQLEEQRIIEILGTGKTVKDSEREFIGTVFMDSFVWHVFERLS